MNCEEKDRLLTAYQNTVVVMAAAAAEMAECAGLTDKETYQSLKLVADQAGKRAAEAQKAFEDHLGAHGC